VRGALPSRRGPSWSSPATFCTRSSPSLWGRHRLASSAPSLLASAGRPGDSKGRTALLSRRNVRIAGGGASIRLREERRREATHPD